MTAVYDVRLDATSEASSQPLAARLFAALGILTFAWFIAGAVAHPSNLNLQFDQNLMGALFYGSYLAVLAVVLLKHFAANTSVLAPYGVSASVINARLKEFRTGLGTGPASRRYIWAALNVAVAAGLLFSSPRFIGLLPIEALWSVLWLLVLNALRLALTRWNLLGGVSVALGIAASLAVFGAIAFVGVLTQPELRAQLPVWSYVLAALVLIPAIALSARFMSGRHPSAYQARKSDRRAPIVFVRSFSDDRELLYQETTFEQVVAREMNRYGPVIAIGAPGVLPRSGAALAFYSGDNWQEAIATWMDAARVIVLVAGETPGLAWEISTAIERGHGGKLLILFPPSATRIEARWGQIASTLRGTSMGDAVAAVRADDALAVVQDRAGDVFVHRGAKRDGHQFLMALRCALYARFCKA